MCKKILFFILINLFTSRTFAKDFLHLFKNKKPIIAAIMVPAFFKDLEEYQKTIDWTHLQAQIASEAEVDGLLIEFRGGGILDTPLSPNQISLMSEIVSSTIKKYPNLVIGVEILWHFPGSTLLLAKKSGAKFVRIDFFSDEVIADHQKVPIDPSMLVKFKKSISEDIALTTDIQVKYSQMINPKTSIDQSAKKALSMGSDGVIVSGSRSGSSPDVEKLIKARKGLQKKEPLIIGSGFSFENAPQLLPLVDAVIVGTSISEKTGGPLIPSKVRQLMAYVKTQRN